MLRISLFLLLSLLVSCKSSQKNKDIKLVLNSVQVQQLEIASSLMEKRQYQKASEIYKELSQTLKDKSSKRLMSFNEAVAHKEAGQCPKALKPLRKLLDRHLKNKEFKARILMEIAQVYECLSQFDLAFMSLKSAEKIRDHLPLDLRAMVFPARMGSAQAREGNLEKADIYKEQALKVSLQLGSSFASEKAYREFLARVFFIMGRSFDKKEKLKAEEFLRAFPYYQIFLLQSLFLKDKTYYPLALEELKKVLEFTLLALDQTKDKELKTYIKSSMETATKFIKKENQTKLLSLYKKRSQKILKKTN